MRERLEKAIGCFAPLVQELPDPVPRLQCGVFYNKKNDQLEFWYLRCRSILTFLQLEACYVSEHAFEIWIRDCIQWLNEPKLQRAFSRVLIELKEEGKKSANQNPPSHSKGLSLTTKADSVS